MPSAFTLKCIAYGTAAAIPLAVHNRYVMKQSAATHSRSNDSAVPRTVFVDRLSHHERNNAILLGSLTGAFLLSQSLLRRSAAIGWCKNVVAMAIGAAPLALLFWPSRAPISSGEPAGITTRLELETDHLSTSMELASISDLVRSALDWAGLKDTALVTEEPRHASENDGSIMAMLGLPGGSTGGSSGSRGGRNSRPPASLPGQPGGAVPEVITDMPHLAMKQGDNEAEIIPQTNYDWFSNDKIAELERLIATMQAKRTELAREAELLWSWASEKEAELYEKFPLTKKLEKGDVQDPAREELANVALILGHIHNNLWRKTLDCDWIIADSQKRIAQEKSLAASGKVEWRPSCSEAASKSPLTHTLSTLKEQLKLYTALTSQVEQQESMMVMALGHPDADADMDTMTMHPLKGQMASQKEVIKDIRQHNKEQLGALQHTKAALEKLIAEIEQKIGKDN